MSIFGALIIYFKIYFFVFGFWLCTQLAAFQFPIQGLNSGCGSESLQS